MPNKPTPLANAIAAYAPDPIFFTKADLWVGTQLRCHGRREGDVPTLWTVVRIETILDGRYTPVNTPRTLKDYVTLERGPHIRETTFATLSYSAIWRLEQ